MIKWRLQKSDYQISSAISISSTSTFENAKNLNFDCNVHVTEVQISFPEFYIKSVSMIMISVF